MHQKYEQLSIKKRQQSKKDENPKMRQIFPRNPCVHIKKKQRWSDKLYKLWNFKEQLSCFVKCAWENSAQRLMIDDFNQNWKLFLVRNYLLKYPLLFSLLKILAVHMMFDYSMNVETIKSKNDRAALIRF